MDDVFFNLSLIVLSISALIITCIYIHNFIKKPSIEQIQQIKEILLYWVILAEKELGSGTGKLKLRYVYDLFISKFPYMVKYITFDKFSEMVDQALEEMKALISSNKKVEAYILPENKEEN